MSESEALKRLSEIVRGIDLTEEGSGSEGWWETSTGAKFGASKLAELENLVRTLARGHDAPLESD